LKLYIDGVLSAVSSNFYSSDYDIANEKPLLIGFGARNYFTGALDDLRLYRGALDASQIESLAQRD
jgi:hypothetical protein